MLPSLDRRGLTYGFSAYFIWGLFPIFMAWLEPAGALEIVAWRSVSSLAVCLLIVPFVAGAWPRIIAVAKDGRTLLRLTAASLLIAVNWGVMVYAVVTDRVASTSLGYYINPLLTVALGVFFLRERLRRLQVVAIGVAAFAVTVVAVDMGGLPWISLVLATTFGLYSFIKKDVGAKVDALTGLTVETAIQLPLAAGVLVWVHLNGSQTLLVRGADGLGWVHDTLLLTTGTWTAGALLIFAAAARRLPLNISGLLQYIAPTMTFSLAVWYFHEPMPSARWAGFALVWVALVLITVDSWRARSSAAVTPPGRVTAPV